MEYLTYAQVNQVGVAIVFVRSHGRMELDGMMAEAGAEVAPEAGASEAGAATTPSTSWTLTWDVSSIYPQG
jgi:hypothetical protein